MNLLQKLLLSLIPKRDRSNAEAESRAWHLVCAACGHSRSVWDMGGVRWKASGNPVSIQKCPSCGVRGKHKLEKRVTH